MERSHHDHRLATPNPVTDVPYLRIVMCAWCWGQRSIMETSSFGLLPVVCQRCKGHGREARRVPGDGTVAPAT